jgi:D-alanine-D-alanine ligase-like ATP-grasp enzyme
LIFFTNVNEFPPDGGMINYSKFEILKRIPNEYLPKTKFIQKNIIKTYQFADDFNFPFVVKPDKGERGRGVKKIHSSEEWQTYLESANEDLIIQSLIEHPLECGIFYVKLPTEIRGRITSITTKEFLSVRGDGISNIGELIAQNERALMQKSKFKQSYLDIIPYKDEVVVLEPIGNHNRGTKFINSTTLANEELISTFNQISKQIEGFNYGRFDIRYENFEDLSEGKNFKIIELNGVNSEPTHIYDQSNGLFQSLRDMCFHWKLMHIISKYNYKKGLKRMTLRGFLNHLYQF